jgi:hypothetical protein
MLRSNFRRYCALVLLAVLGCALVIWAVPASRHAVLKGAGWMLVAEDPPAEADIIIVSTDSLGAGLLEAGGLVHSGFAKRVAVFEHQPGPVQAELVRRGLPHMDLQAWSIDLLHALGVTQISVIPPVVGTNDEGAVLRKWCKENSIRSLIFVSVPDHSRRSRRVLNRALHQDGITVTVRWTRFSQFDPDSWWQTRNGQRVEIVESQKLIADVLRHPF